MSTIAAKRLFVTLLTLMLVGVSALPAEARAPYTIESIVWNADTQSFEVEGTVPCGLLAAARADAGFAVSVTILVAQEDVFLNVTAVFPSAPGFLTVFPCGEPLPGASNVNYFTGEVIPQAVLGGPIEPGLADVTVESHILNPAGRAVAVAEPFTVYDLSITSLEICDDGVDNDGDELVDADDPDCGGIVGGPG